MLPVSMHLVIILCVLGRTLCLDVKKDTLPINTTAEATSIVECFTKAVDMPWQFSVEEHSSVLFFEYATSDLCDRKFWRIFVCNYPLMKYLQQVYKFQSSSVDKEQEHHKTKILEHYEDALKLQRQAINVLQKLILLIQNVKLLADVTNQTKILNDNCSKQFLDIDNLKNTSTEFVAEYAQMQIHLDIFRIQNNTLWYYMPPFIVIIFICGMIGNGMLLFIFARHPETRAGPNVMLVNLATSDTLFLFCNVALDYCKKLWGFPLGVTACYLYNFFLTLITGSCVYSMTMLSLCRYLAITAKPGKGSNVLLSSTSVIVVIVWIWSSIVAIPDTLNTNTENLSTCGAKISFLNALCDFFLISLLPLISIAGFYMIASKRLRDSAQNMPGEALGRIKVKMARERGAKILPALAVVFAITYLPFYTLFATIVVFKINTSNYPIFHRFFYMAYFLFNLNSTLNPVALYVASSMFRKYFNMYLFLGFMKKQTPMETPNKTQVIVSGL